MEQVNKAIEALQDEVLRKQFEREAEENTRAEEIFDRKNEQRELQKHYREIQKQHCVIK